MKQHVKMLKKILEAEKVKFKEIDERIVNEEQLLEQAKVDKVAADAEIDTMAAMDAENRIQAHERALVMLRERRSAIMDEQEKDKYTNQIKNEIQALEVREKLSNEEVFEQLQTLAKQIADIRIKYDQLYIDVESQINEYKGYIRGELVKELIREHRNLADQKYRLYSGALENVNKLIEQFQQENIYGLGQKYRNELTKVSSELSKLSNELIRYKHRTAVTSWDREYMRTAELRIQELRARNRELTTSGII